MKNYFRSILILCLIGTTYAYTQAQPQETNNPSELQEYKTVAVNDTHLAYIEAGAGTPVVLVHGALADFRYWPSVFDTLSESYHVYAYSRRSFYPNEKISETQTGPLDAQDLLGFIQNLELGPVHIIGHSSGGHIGLEFASQYPELLLSFTSVEGGFLTDGADSANELMQPIIEQAMDYIAAGQPDLAASTFLDVPLGPGVYSNMPETVKLEILSNIHTLAHSLSDLNCSDAQRIKAPSLIIEGALSPETIGLAMDRLRPCISGVQSVMIANASHDVFIDNPKDFNEALLLFLDNVKGQ